MYLKQVFIENSGPLKHFELDIEFTNDGRPKPLLLVGTNGAGKTNLLSLIADAIFEAAAIHYKNVLPTQGIGRAWFRVLGGSTITVGAAGSFSLLRFQHKNTNLIYKEKSGEIDPSEAAKRTPKELSSYLNWEKIGAFKEFSISDEESKKIFAEEVHAFFPSSRSEVPFWLNRNSIPDTEFSISVNLSNELRKPIYVERSLYDFKQWILSVILESRTYYSISTAPESNSIVQLPPDFNNSILALNTLETCNNILKLILEDENVRFAWSGRKSSEKLAVARDNHLHLPNLDALSAGQSILLGLFGTLLRYADYSQSGAGLDLNTIEGICVIDEIDSHIHVDLQYKIIPSLIALFPKIQFIISCHSPLFVLGMQNKFGGEGIQLVEMPNGNIISPETYSEFERAMEVLAATETFNSKILTEMSRPGKPIIFVEGETDGPYIRRSAELLDRPDLLERCEIEWIGEKTKDGQGINTGKNALTHAWQFFKANPKLINRPVMLLYDSDAKITDEDFENVSVRSVPINQNNLRVTIGIENLLSSESIVESDYKTKKYVKPDGTEHTEKKYDKVQLCSRLCKSGTKDDFSAFGGLLDIIQAFLERVDSRSMTS